MCAPAQDEISLHEFEQFALDRMRVLKAIDAAKAKGMKADEMKTTIDKLCAQYLPMRDDLLTGACGLSCVRSCLGLFSVALPGATALPRARIGAAAGWCCGPFLP